MSSPPGSPTFREHIASRAPLFVLVRAKNLSAARHPDSSAGTVALRPRLAVGLP
jgi:hypothetical protein